MCSKAVAAVRNTDVAEGAPRRPQVGCPGCIIISRFAKDVNCPSALCQHFEKKRATREEAVVNGGKNWGSA